MYEVTWTEINRKDQLVTKRKSFKTEAAMQKYIEKLVEKDNYYGNLATR